MYMYRCVIRYTDPKYRKCVSNLFIRGEDSEKVRAYARNIMKAELIKNKFNAVEFSVVVLLSSEEEATAYRARMNRHLVDKEVN